MREVAFSWRMLRRNWRAGELRVLLFALAVAVASVTSVGFFNDRVRNALSRQAGELLAADRVVESGKRIAPLWESEARALGLRTAHSLAFRSVVVAGERLELAEVKAVGAGYPLRGALRVADRPYGPERTVAGGPEQGTAFAEPRLLQALGLQPGDRLMLGSLEVTVAALLAYEPDRGGDLFSIAPRLLINIEDIPATGLIQTGSLVSYRLMLSGPEAALERYGDRIGPLLAPGERLLGVRDARPELTSALDRAERYLGLAALASVLLAGVAVATAAHRYARRHLDAAAVMRCLGASRRFLAAGFVWQLVWIALLATLVGMSAGFLVHQAIVALLGGLFAPDLPLPSPRPIFFGFVTALVTLGGFALPPLLAAGRVPPMRLLRRDLLPAPVPAKVIYGSALAALGAMMIWQAGDLTLAALVLAGSLATVALLALAARGLLYAVRWIRRGGVAWRFGLAGLTRRSRSAVTQVVAFGLGIAVLLLLTLVRGDLLAQWRDRLPPDAPNHFLINVLPEQVEEVGRFFRERGKGGTELYPMVRGRLVAINDREISAADYSDPGAQRLVRREFNLSWSREVPEENSIARGRWWGAAAAPEQWSVEEGLAANLGIALGDRLVFSVSGQRVEGKVTSLRRLEWDSFNVNFFVVAPPGLLDSYPASYITSFYLPEADKPLLADLVRRFPNVTVIDVEAIMARVRGVMERVALAVEFVFAFTLAAGFAVLYAAIQATRDERLHETAVLRTLGARRRQILGALATEFAALGALAGLLAAAGATLLGWALAEFAFGFDYAFNGWIWLAGVTAGVVGIGGAGLLATWRVIEQPPLWTLRRM